MTETGSSKWEKFHSAGVQLVAEGRTERAEGAFRLAISAAESISAFDPRLASSLSALGRLKQQERDLDGAAALFARSLAIVERACGDSHPQVLEGLNALAGVHVARGDLDMAEPLLVRALSVAERTYGFDAQELSAPLNALARLYFKRNRHRQAGPLLERLLLIKQSLGNDHPEVATVVASIATMHAALGENVAAEKRWREVVAVRESKLGADDAALAPALEGLAEACEAQRKHADAVTHLERALAIRELRFGAEHGSAVSTRRRLGEVRALVPPPSASPRRMEAPKASLKASPRPSPKAHPKAAPVAPPVAAPVAPPRQSVRPLTPAAPVAMATSAAPAFVPPPMPTPVAAPMAMPFAPPFAPIAHATPSAHATPVQPAPIAMEPAPRANEAAPLDNAEVMRRHSQNAWLAEAEPPKHLDVSDSPFGAFAPPPPPPPPPRRNSGRLVMPGMPANLPEPPAQIAPPARRSGGVSNDFLGAVSDAPALQAPAPLPPLPPVPMPGLHAEPPRAPAPRPAPVEHAPPPARRRRRSERAPRRPSQPVPVRRSVWPRVLGTAVLLLAVAFAAAALVVTGRVPDITSWLPASSPPPRVDSVPAAPVRQRAPITVPIARSGSAPGADKTVIVERGAAFVGDTPRSHVEGEDPPATAAPTPSDSTAPAPDASRLTVPPAADGALSRVARDLDARIGARVDSAARDNRVKLPGGKP